MKKTLLYSLCSLALAAFALPAWGQVTDGYHIPNGDFSEWKSECGSSYQTSGGTLVGKGAPLGLRQRPGVEPTDWNGSNVNQKVFASGANEKLVTKGTDGSNAYVVLTNTYVGIKGVAGSNAPAYMTFGTPWVYAIKNTDKCDGGTFGGTTFKGKPDAIRGKFKRTKGSSDENAHIIAYLWAGTFVSEIACSDAKNDLTTMSVDDADKAVLGKVECSSTGTLVASCDFSFATTKDNGWETIEVPLTYNNGNVLPEKMNVIVSSADYWTRTNIQENSKLEVDDLEYVYYHALSSCSYNGSDVAFNNNNKAVVIAPDGYDANKLAYTVKGVGATVEKSYDNSTDELTITVKGNDYVANSKSFTTYTIQFVKSSQNYTEDLNLCVFGEVLDPMSATVTVQTRYDGKFNFQLKNFALGEEGPVGTINVYGLERDGDAFSAKSVDAIISEGDYEADWMLAGQTIPLDIKGHFVGDDHLRVGIDIELEEDMVVNVALGYSPAIANMAVKAGNQYGTFYAPFDVTPTVGVKAYTCKEMKGNTLVLEELTDDVIPAKTAVVVERTDGSDAISQNFYNFDEDLKLENGHTGYLYGAAEGGTTIVPKGSYVLQNQDGNEKFFLVAEEVAGWTVSANRCYLQLPAAAGVKSLSLTTGATAIEAVKNLLNGKSEIYDLEGRRLPALQKGINIVNGKRVLVK